jgi:hypothetical protein
MTQISEVVKLANRETNGLYPFQMFYGKRDCENMSSVTSRKDFITQNCSVKKWDVIFTICIKTVKED